MNKKEKVFWVVILFIVVFFILLNRLTRIPEPQPPVSIPTQSNSPVPSIPLYPCDDAVEKCS